MKKLRLCVLAFLVLFALPSLANAASANISVKANGSAVVGNTVTATVTVSSSTPIGSWQFLVSYDTSLLKLTSGETSVADTTKTSSGVKSKSYTLKFKALKSGTATIKVGSYMVISMADDSEMSVSSKSASVKIQTKEQVEASYSTNANLTALRVGEYALNPVFNKTTFEYNVEVENEIESVNVEATKEDSKSSVSGTGEIKLNEGNNRVKVVVTAQKGNTQTYVINIMRKELNPIQATVLDENYTIIRKADALEEKSGFILTEIDYNGETIPALKSEVAGITLIGLKDEAGEIKYFIYDEEIKSEYTEIKSNSYVLYPLDLKKNNNLSLYTKREMEINGVKVEGYSIDKNSKRIILYAQNIETGEIGYYTYDALDSSIQRYSKETDEFYQELVNKYKYVLCGSAVLIVLLFLLLIFRKPKKKKEKREAEKQEVTEKE